jgi:hypothetical protein
MTDRAVIINGAGTRFTLIEDMEFPEEGVTVPAGYRCDFASTPKVFWSLGFTPLGRHQWASVLHDFLYGIHHSVGVLSWGRKQTDRAFLRQMKRDGVGWRTRYTMYLAVRLFGGFYWNKKP